MVKIFVFFWCVAGLLTLDVLLRTPSLRVPRPSPTALSAASTVSADSMPVIAQIRTRCELPAGTVVFVVRGRETSP